MAIEFVRDLTPWPDQPEHLHFREACGGDTIDVERLLSAVLHVNSAPWREYPAETLILRGVDVSPNATVDFQIDRGGSWVEVERINRCQVYARTDFNAIPELAAALLVPVPPAEQPCPSVEASPYVELAPRTPCPDCRGTGKYQGLASVEQCRTCGGRGTTLPS